MPMFHELSVYNSLQTQTVLLIRNYLIGLHSDGLHSDATAPSAHIKARPNRAGGSAIAKFIISSSTTG